MTTDTSHPVLSLADRAYLSIRERILRGALRAGSPLSRRRVAAELGMSLLPVSEAFQRLESDGLLESRPRAGTRVRAPNEQDIRERFEVREALESQAARLFAVRATGSDREEIRRWAEQLDLLFNRLWAGESDAEFPYTVYDFHSQFHMRVAECARCSALRQLVDKNLLILHWGCAAPANRSALPPGFHRDLADVLTSGDPLAADRAMRDHVRYGLDEKIRKLEASPSLEWRERRNTRQARDTMTP